MGGRSADHLPGTIRESHAAQQSFPIFSARPKLKHHVKNAGPVGKSGELSQFLEFTLFKELLSMSYAFLTIVLRSSPSSLAFSRRVFRDWCRVGGRLGNSTFFSHFLNFQLRVFSLLPRSLTTAGHA